MIGAIFGILSQILLLVLIVTLVRRLGSLRRGEFHGSNIRRAFQYLILFGLVTLIGYGITGLATAAINASRNFVTDSVGLARDTTFVVVAIPVATFLFLWIRKQFRADESEKLAFTFRSYILGISLLSLANSLFALYDILMWALGDNELNRSAIPRLVVWAVIFIVHWRIRHSMLTEIQSTPHFLMGSLVGLTIMIVGLIQVLNRFFQWVLRTEGDTLVSTGTGLMARGAIVFLIGGAVWYLYWLRHAVVLKREPLWLAYTLLAGTAASIILVIVSLSLALNRVLVWFIGEPTAPTQIDHFTNLPLYLACASIGLLVWLYHQSLLDTALHAERVEIVRIREYLLSAIGLVTTGVGVALVIVSLIETITSSTVVTGGSSINTLLTAGTLLISGVPLWWYYWSHAQRALHREPHIESLSPSRRVYLLLLFGLMGLTAIGTLLAAVFIFFQDLFEGNFSLATLNRIRVPLSILVTTGAVSLYHWSVRHESAQVRRSNLRQSAEL